MMKMMRRNPNHLKKLIRLKMSGISKVKTLSIDGQITSLKIDKLNKSIPKAHWYYPELFPPNAKLFCGLCQARVKIGERKCPACGVKL
jgi:hypothetical protein